LQAVHFQVLDPPSPTAPPVGIQLLLIIIGFLPQLDKFSGNLIKNIFNFFALIAD
jgi:hypothetical protein